MFDPASIPNRLRAVEPGRLDAVAARVEDASLNVAQPRQQSFYDGWLLRYSPGKAKRARSINAIGTGVLPLAEKLAHCTEFYARRRLPCLYRVTPFSRPHDLDRTLEAAGYHAFQDTRVMTLELSDEISRARTPAMRWVDVEHFARAFCELHTLDAVQTQAEAERYARSVVDAAYIVRYGPDAKTPIGCGSVAIEGDLAGIFGMVTASAHRRQGIADALLASLLNRARTAGARIAYLQVEEGNRAARHAYGKFGFIDRYAYWYRVRPEDAALDSTSSAQPERDS